MYHEGEIKGRIKGLIQGVELALTVKFPEKLSDLMVKIQNINDLALLNEIVERIKTARDDAEIMALLK